MCASSIEFYEQGDWADEQWKYGGFSFTHFIFRICNRIIALSQNYWVSLWRTLAQRYLKKIIMEHLFQLDGRTLTLFVEYIILWSGSVIYFPVNSSSRKGGNILKLSLPQKMSLPKKVSFSPKMALPKKMAISKAGIAKKASLLFASFFVTALGVVLGFSIAVLSNIPR